MNVVGNTLIAMATIAVVVFVLFSIISIYGAYSLNSEGYVYNPVDHLSYPPGSSTAQAIKAREHFERYGNK